MTPEDTMLAMPLYLMDSIGFFYNIPFPLPGWNDWVERWDNVAHCSAFLGAAFTSDFSPRLLLTKK
jgi:hypothetical protein